MSHTCNISTLIPPTIERLLWRRRVPLHEPFPATPRQTGSHGFELEALKIACECSAHSASFTAAAPDWSIEAARRAASTSVGAKPHT